MPTAFEEALASMNSAEGAKAMPGYITSADTLSLANKNPTFAEAALDVVDSIPKFIAVSALSGANQLYNVPADIGNLFGADIERSDTAELISGLDSNLGEFYKENQEGADLVGFMASSLIPGLGGVRVLNAGQKALSTAIATGRFGEGTAKGLRLLTPMKDTYLKRAIQEATTNSGAANLVSKNSLKAMAAGVNQNVLEALAFETAVAATLFNSPTLEGQELGDLVTNIAWNAGVFGIVGGAVDAAKIAFSLKRATNEATAEARPWQFIPEAHSASSPYERIAIDYESLHNIPPIPTGLEPGRAEFLTQAAKTKTSVLEDRLRVSFHQLTGGDTEAALSLFSGLKGTSYDTKQSSLMGLLEASRLTAAPITKEVKGFTKLQNKVLSKKATLDEVEEYASSTIHNAYVKLWGEDAGRTITDMPKITNLVDTLKAGQTIKVAPSGVTAGKRSFSFNLNYNKGVKSLLGTVKPWDLMKAAPLETQARTIWVSKLAPLAPTAEKPFIVNVNDIPMMEKVALELADSPALEHVQFTGMKPGEAIRGNLHDYLGDKKIELAHAMLKREGNKLTQEEIAATLNVKNSFLSGELVVSNGTKYSPKDMYAMQDHALTYTEKLKASGSIKKDAPTVDVWNVPQHLKLTYDPAPFKGIDNNVVEQMTIIKGQQKAYQEGTSNAAAGVLGEDYAKYEDITSGRVYEGAMPSGAGANYISAASNNYGSLAGTAEYLGNLTSLVTEKFKERTRSSLEPLLYKLGNNEKAAIEWSVINQRVRSIEGQYGLNEAGDALEPLAMLRYRAAAKEAQAKINAGEKGVVMPRKPKLSNPAMEARIELVNPEVRELAKAHIELNGKRTGDLASLRTAQGLQYNRSPDVFYPIPVNPRDYPHFAMVIDDSITGAGHSTTLFAASAEELAASMAKLKQNPQLKVLTKAEAERYYDSIGQWSYEKTLSDNYLDTAVHRTGVSAPTLPATDPKKITEDFLNWHMQRETGLVREAVSAKYEVQFEELRRLGDEYTNISTSQYSDINLLRFAADKVANPYQDYIKTALNIKKTSDYPVHVNLNRLVDNKFSEMYKRIDDAFGGTKTTSDFAAIDATMRQYGYKGAAYDESMALFANATPSTGKLSSLVQAANGILATVVLRWDALNAVNNAVSSTVLLGAETASLTRLINSGGKGAADEFNALTRINVPGTAETIMAPTKLISNAIKKFNRKGDDFSFYEQHGYMTSISRQYSDALDRIAFNPADGAEGWRAKLDGLVKTLKVAGDKGEKFTGNKLAEEFNRFVAADVMKQMTDVAIGKGLMTAQEQLAYINTFVNRTQGNYLASQRPMMFHGPIGSAIGLFQTYQFNLLQQLLRHVGEGHTKDGMTLLGLQGTIHGMNGLPAFNAINTNLVGNASGNVEHRDAYDAVYGIAGKEAGDWLTYGMASNALGLLHPDLKVNLYTRGDINPRQVTLVPTDPASVPIIQATAKVFGNIFETTKKLGAGGDVSKTLLQGLEHNGISRPLAGLAQTLEAFTNPEQASYSTSKRGNVIAANDLLSLANVARMAGGKPMNEAIAIDALYRNKAYDLKDKAKRDLLGEAIKTKLIGGGIPTQEEMNDFAAKYARTGGKQEQYNKWMLQLYKNANLSQVSALQDNLGSDFNQSMQRLMGGKEVRDFYTPGEAKPVLPVSGMGADGTGVAEAEF